ncbi:fibrinogen-like protein 1 [Saccostrea cucullata]|uniref:fibrinogen-like protein 1 n=1 Tax=Saccostrea cuccullata TaxID=36930 RepID=UPI002ED04304
MKISRATISSWRYTAKLELDNKMSNDELVGQHEVHSLIECAATCQRDCEFFGYNSTLKKCRTHKKAFTSGMSDETGWRYYFPEYLPIRDKVHSGQGSLKHGYNGRRVDGNDLIHQLTKEITSSLYVTIALQNGTTLYEMYDGFSVSDEAGKYQIFLAGPATGTLGDSMLDTGYSARDLSGMSFSTPDRDNDRSSGINCAARSIRRGGWWFNFCHRAFLNGQWSSESWYRPWYPTVTSGTSVKATLMMIRRN